MKKKVLALIAIGLLVLGIVAFVSKNQTAMIIIIALAWINVIAGLNS